MLLTLTLTLISTLSLTLPLTLTLPLAGALLTHTLLTHDEEEPHRTGPYSEAL